MSGARARKRDDALPADAPRETQEGVVDRVVFANEQSGFRVLRVRVGSATTSWAGAMPAVSVGESVKATGVVVTDPKFGAQLKVETMAPVMPTSTPAMERYLSSGVLPGIGEALAKRIVKAFGDDTVAVFDSDPDRLLKIKGVSRTKLDAIKEAWGEQRAVMEIMAFLQQHGASPALARKIHKRFGARAFEVVQTAPYRLAIEVHGIGFIIADRIAKSIGVAHDSPDRAQAGVLHQLHELEHRGHVYTEFAELAAVAAKALEIDVAAAEQAIRALHGARRVVDDGGPVYTAALYAAETRLAGRLRGLLGGATKGIAQHVERAVEAVEKEKGITIAPEQREAISLAAHRKVLVITGGPGTGKSAGLRALLELFDRAKLEVRLAAPTGRAAKRMNEATGRTAMTIHRLLEFNPREGGFTRNADRPIEADVVVVDEASMIDLALADHLVDAVPDHARLIFIGDVDQLPSVGPGAVLRDVIASGAVPTVRLTRIFRQAEGSAIVESAHRINHGENPVGDTAADGEFFVIERAEAEAAADTIVEMVTRRIPERFGFDAVRDVQVLSPMHKGPAGVGALNARLQAQLNPGGAEMKRGGNVFRAGDKVLQLRNDYDREVWNGDIGFVTSVDPEEGELVVDIDGRAVNYEGSEIDDLALAYAMSIHKSQGGEFAAIVMPMLKSHWIMLSRNLLYTGVTRGKRLVVLVSDPKALAQAIVETKRDVRRTGLAERLRAAASR